jgi:tRNA isopentenyl-2-thiomethyl-A-37 hydroxylase MiaE
MDCENMDQPRKVLPERHLLCERKYQQGAATLIRKAVVSTGFVDVVFNPKSHLWSWLHIPT